MTRVALVVALTALAAPSAARACASCGVTVESFAGVDEQGRLATVSSESTGESDYQEIWLLRVSRGTHPLCMAEAMVDKTVSYFASGERECETILGLGPKDRDPEALKEPSGEHRFRTKRLERAAFVAKVRARFPGQLTAVPAPDGLGVEPVADADGYTGDSKQQPVTIDGVQVGHVVAGASRWALSAYTSPHFDGVVIRLVTLISDPDHRLGSSSGCTDYFDGYLAVPRARIEAARLIAQARKAPTPVESLAFAERAVAADPEWSGAQDELRRRQRRTRRGK